MIDEGERKRREAMVARLKDLVLEANVKIADLHALGARVDVDVMHTNMIGPNPASLPMIVVEVWWRN